MQLGLLEDLPLPKQVTACCADDPGLYSNASTIAGQPRADASNNLLVWPVPDHEEVMTSSGY